MNILLAEDEQRLATAIAQIFKEHKYQVDIVYDGQDALDYITAGDYDVFVCDVIGSLTLS